MKEKSLLEKNFILVVVGQIISLFGNAILRFALPLYLLRETGSAALFGIVTACSFLPMIVLSVLGGVLADRVNKRNIMVILDFSTAIIILAFTLALGRLSVVPLFILVLMLLYGIQGAYQPAVQASIPALVHTEKLMPANAIINQVNALANLLGPIIGGILFSSWGIMPILLISICCFTASAVMEIFIKIPYEKQKIEENLFYTVWKDLKISMHFMRKEQPVLYQITFLLAAFNLFISAMLIVGLPVLLIDTLGINDKLFGYSQGALALGGLVGGILTGLLGNKLKIKKSYKLLLACAMGVVPMSFVLFLDLPVFISYLIITIMSFLLMMVSTMFSIQMLAFVQSQTPVVLIGKVISCLLAVSMSAQPIGQALYGILFEKLAANPGIILLGSALIASGIALYSKKIFARLH